MYDDEHNPYADPDARQDAPDVVFVVAVVMILALAFIIVKSLTT